MAEFQLLTSSDLRMFENTLQVMFDEEKMKMLGRQTVPEMIAGYSGVVHICRKLS